MPTRTANSSGIPQQRYRCWRRPVLRQSATAASSNLRSPAMPPSSFKPAVSSASGNAKQRSSGSDRPVAKKTSNFAPLTIRWEISLWGSRASPLDVDYPLVTTVAEPTFRHSVASEPRHRPFGSAEHVLYSTGPSSSPSRVNGTAGEDPEASRSHSRFTSVHSTDASSSAGPIYRALRLFDALGTPQQHP